MLCAGGLLGVSFIAAPAKFWAPSLTLPVALDVGRHTFQFFNKLEITALLVLAILTYFATRDGFTRGIVLILGLILIFQTAWLLPLLDQRVSIVLQGQTPLESKLHLVYIACDVWRFFLLISISWKLRPSQSGQP